MQDPGPLSKGLLSFFLDVRLVPAAKYVLYMMPKPKSLKKAQHIPYPASTLTLKVKKTSNMVVLHIKRSVNNHWWSRKNRFSNYGYMSKLWPKKSCTNALFCHFPCINSFFWPYIGHFTIFCKTEFCLIISDSKLLLLICNTTIFQKWDFLPI